MKFSTVYDALTVEKQLNKILVGNVPIGGLFSKLLFITIRKDPRIKEFNKFYGPLLIALKSIKNNRGKKNISPREIILGFTSNRKNFKDLVYQQKKYFSSKYLFYGPSISDDKDELGYSFDDFPNVGFTKCLKLFFLSLFIFPAVRKIFYQNNLKCGAFNIFNYLYVQVLKLESFKEILKNTNIVLVDYDRSFPMAPLILAANANNINTVTLIHGTINSVYGYHPFLAKEVWCWGEFQKLQLQKLGVDIADIKIVGNPAVKEMDHHSKIKAKDDKTFIIGVVLDRHNKELINLLQSSLMKINHLKVKVIFKTHPMMEKNEFKEDWLNKKINYCIIDKVISPKEFFYQCDLIVSKGSSMSFEALLHDTPVVLVDLYDGTGVQENLILMKNLLSMLVISTPEELADFILNFNSNNRGNFEIQKQKLLNKFYYKTGNEAAREISKNLRKYLNYSTSQGV